jgi:hypothetical protein
VIFSDRPVRLRAVLVSCGLLLLVGCQTTTDRDSPVQSRDFRFEDIAKADVDMVAEVNVMQSLAYLRELSRKLYVRNPNQLTRGGHASREAALAQLFGPRRLSRFEALEGARAADAINLAFDPGFVGDRIQALAFGMRSMLLDAYGGDEKLFLHESLDPQKLYYLARNFEIAFWKLKNDRDEHGQLLLLSNALQGSGDLSFERLGGKLIALQDLMAQVIADTTNRQIKTVIQSVASAVFFPI